MRVLALVLACAATWAAAGPPEERFREATAAVRDGDAVAGIRVFRELAAEGVASPSLYWNWAQAAAARGRVGEAMWALLRCRQLEPGDASVRRELDRLRQLVNLSPAELAPQPLAEVGQLARRWQLGWAAILLLALSVGLHATARWLAPGARWPVLGTWVTLGVGVVLALPAGLVPKLTHPQGTVARAGASLYDAASPHAMRLGTLREGEVVPILARSGAYLRVEDSSGARGWALADEVWPLDDLPPAEALR